MSQTEEAVPLDKLTRVYMKMRAKMQEIEAEYEAKIDSLKEQQKEVKNAIKDLMLAQGSKSVRTDYGTVMLTEKTRFYTQDWDSFKTFVVEQDAVDLLERRIHQGNMAKFLEENPSLLPPGLNSDTEFDVSVRKPSTK
jgi:hypothetical protein